MSLSRLLLAAALAGWAAGPAPADVPVEGDADALRTFREALAKAPEAYPSGTMTYRAVYTSGSRPVGASELEDPLVTTTHGTIGWGPAGMRWDVDKESEGGGMDRGRPADRTTLPPIPEGTRALTVLRDLRGERRIVRRRLGGSLQSVSIDPDPADARTDDEALAVDPANGWFHTRAGQPWTEFLDPAENNPTLVRFEAAREGDEIVVRRHHAGDLVYEIRGVLADPARVTSVTTEVPDPETVGRTFTSEWAETPGRAPHPTRIERAIWMSYDGRVHHQELTLTVEEFRPSAPTNANSASDFTLKALDLPRGTKVRYHNERSETVREAYVGGSAPTAEERTEDALEGLSELLKADDFAGGTGDDR